MHSLSPVSCLQEKQSKDESRAARLTRFFLKRVRTAKWSREPASANSMRIRVSTTASPSTWNGEHWPSGSLRGVLAAQFFASAWSSCLGHRLP